MLADTHCHLDFPEFDADRDEVIKRAKNEDIGYIINIGSSLLGSKKALELSQQYDFIYATVGLHPHEADKFDDEIRASIEKLAREDRVVAIGETGLDYYKNYSKTENQKTLFRYLVKLAKDSGLPLVIHSRQAQEDTLKILNEVLPIKAVVHCFSGDEDFLRKCLDLDFFISFTCNITYPAKLSKNGRDPACGNKPVERDNRAQNLRTLVKLTPLDRLMLETDAPFLSPEGLRGKRNEPAYVKFLAEEIARIKEIAFEEVARVTTDNARRFFNLP
ncbi:MAG: TatD family hydrolase [Candidatus Omnitrophota bacterium]|nr:TatD family hydrolase [Candidatus Omnitrophota bacterium]